MEVVVILLLGSETIEVYTSRALTEDIKGVVRDPAPRLAARPKGLVSWTQASLARDKQTTPKILIIARMSGAAHACGHDQSSHQHSANCR